MKKPGLRYTGKQGKMENKKLPFVSIVIITYNGLDILKTCFPSIFRIEYPKDKYEIILVDNASVDNTIDYMKKSFPKVRIIRNSKNLGYVGLNSAVKFCKGKYIYFNNNDMTFDKNSVRKLVNVLENDETIAMAAPRLANYYDSKLVSGGTWASKAMYSGHMPKTDDKKLIEIPYMGAGMIRSSVTEKFGYLFDDDYFIYAEDLDLGLRIRLLGMRTIQVNDALNFHMHSLTMKKYSTRYRNTFLLERNLLATLLKIFSIPTTIKMLAYAMVLRVLTISRDILTLNFKSAAARLMAILNVTLNLGRIIGKRKKLQSLRKANDDYILKIFTEKYLFRKPFNV